MGSAFLDESKLTHTASVRKYVGFDYQVGVVCQIDTIG